MQQESLDELIDRVALEMTAMRGEPTTSARVLARLPERSAPALGMLAAASVAALLVLLVSAAVGLWPQREDDTRRLGREELIRGDVLLPPPRAHSIATRVAIVEPSAPPRPLHMAPRAVPLSVDVAPLIVEPLEFDSLPDVVPLAIGSLDVAALPDEFTKEMNR